MRKLRRFELDSRSNERLARFVAHGAEQSRSRAQREVLRCRRERRGSGARAFAAESHADGDQFARAVGRRSHLVAALAVGHRSRAHGIVGHHDRNRGAAHRRSACVAHDARECAERTRSNGFALRCVVRRLLQSLPQVVEVDAQAVLIAIVAVSDVARAEVGEHAARMQALAQRWGARECVVVRRHRRVVAVPATHSRVEQQRATAQRLELVAPTHLALPSRGLRAPTIREHAFCGACRCLL